MNILTNLHGRLLFYLYPLFLALLLFILGACGVLLWWDPEFWQEAKDWGEYNDPALLFIGALGLLLGALLFYNVFSWWRHKTLLLGSKPYAAEVDQKVVEETLQRYLSGLYAPKQYRSKVQIKNDVIHLFIELPKSTERDRKTLLKRMQAELNSLFSSILGYSNELSINISFVR